MISLDLSLDGQTKLIQLSENQFDSIYKPLINRIVDLQHREQRRILIGIAGPPGCGKTYFSKLLTMLLNRNSQQELAVCIGMDGWHYSQQQLEQKAICRDGKMMLLKSFKGSPESYDIDGFLHFLNQLHSDEILSFPVYDRTIHDPVENAGQVFVSHQIIVVEGNYLLLNDYLWDEIRPLLDLSCFIWAGEKLRWDTLLKRHLKGGKSTSQALKHTRYVDMANARRIGRPQVDIQLSRISENELTTLDSIIL